MHNWELIISGAILANFFTWYFEPLAPIREFIVGKWVDFFIKRNWFWGAQGVKLITCAKCLAFWGILVYTFSLTDAVIASMLALTLKSLLKYVESKSN